MKRILCLAIAASLALAGCGGKKRARLPAAARIGSTETGIASWYGYPYHGRRAASGEIYDMEKMTAAHRTLPFGTWVRVRNLENDKTVDVRITDRGPFVRGRVLDLSHAGAVAIAMIGPGTAKVRITVISASAVVAITAPVPPTAAAPPPAPPPIPPAPVPSAQFAVQVGAFADQARAESVRSAMEARYGSAKLVMRDAQPPVWRVLVGHEPTEEGAAALADRIRADANSPAADAFVVRLDNEPDTNDI